MISGERPAPEQAEADAGFRRRFERRFGKFSRTFSVRAFLCHIASRVQMPRMLCRSYRSHHAVEESYRVNDR